jgi:hypothetical protein
MQRHLQQMPGDTLVGGRHSLRFQHITLIQEILATTWTCSRLRLLAPRANLKCFLKTVPFHLALVRWKKADWFACFFGVNSMLFISILNTQRKPSNILMWVCLLCGLLSLVLFWQLTREWGVLWKGAFYRTPGLPCRPTILPSVGLHAG